MIDKQEVLQENLTQYLLNNLEKIHNFDLTWTTLITNTPMLFEDVDYAKVSNFIDNEVTKMEIEKYKSGEISELYHNFETLLVCNLSKYDRIMNYATMVFYQYVKIGDSIVNKEMNKVVAEISMTPTKLYCCSMTSISSTKTELEYAWGVKLNEPDNNQSILEFNWQKLYKKSSNFRLFMQYNAARVQSNGFRETWLNDITTNSKLAKVCGKFTNKSNAIDYTQLTEIFSYHQYITKTHQELTNALRKCMNEMFSSNEQNYAVYCYENEFYLHSIKFSMRVEKSKGKILKEYMANNHECFIAEKYIVESMNEQIKWVKNETPPHLIYQQKMLQNLLFNLLNSDYREVVCLKNMYNKTLSKVTFSGIFTNLYLKEELIFENRVIKVNKICKSKLNAAKYLIKRGYTIFGNIKDIDQLLIKVDNHELNAITNEMLNDHYNQYCKPVINHMFDVVQIYQQAKNDIIDVLCYDKINPEKLNNINIKTSIVKSDKNPLKNISKKMINTRNSKSYWKITE